MDLFIDSKNIGSLFAAVPGRLIVAGAGQGRQGRLGSGRLEAMPGAQIDFDNPLYSVHRVKGKDAMRIAAVPGRVVESWRHGVLQVSAALPLALSPAVPFAQGVHLNPVIAKLEAGETVYGLSTQDLSIAYARQAARAPVDFLYI
jgi:hypothetical protein